MEKAMKIFLTFILMTITFSAQAFTLIGSDIATYKDPNIKVYVGSQQCTNLADSPEELLDLVSEANERFWNGIATSELVLEVGSTKSVDASFYTDQICNTGAGCVPEVDSGILIVCNTNGSTFGGNVLAVTLPNNVSGNTIHGSVIALNDTASSPLLNDSRDEKISVIAHEIGHAIGLGHSNFKDSLMYYANIDNREALGQDDWDGATFLYPKEQGAMAVCGTIEDISNPQNGSKLWFSMALMLLILAGFYLTRRFKSLN